MQETIYNILYFPDKGMIHEAAICSHDLAGSDEEKEAWLKAQVASDIPKANRVTLDSPISQDKFVAMHRLGRQLELFKPLFVSVGAPVAPFCCITPIVNGVPKIDIVSDHTPLTAEEMQSVNSPTLNKVKDWLSEYATEKGFDLHRLLNADYFTAIRLLFNESQYVSCMKLLVSFIDTVSFLAYGDDKSVFTQWLNRHVDLNELEITSEELWEMRNALLHMSNLDSRKVLKGDVRRIAFCVASPGICSPPDRDVIYFNLLDLIEKIAKGISSWISHINQNPDEFIDFVQRYDRILSDDRLAYIKKV